MKTLQAQRALDGLASEKRAYRSRDLALLFAEQGEALRSTIRRLLSSGVIERVARDVYWYNTSTPSKYQPVEEIASQLRVGDLCYVGMESAASRWGVISQIPVERLVVVTTGREGEFKTRFGVIEFVHTKADSLEIAENTLSVPDSPLRLATKRYTVRGLTRAHRSLDLIDWDEVEDVA